MNFTQALDLALDHLWHSDKPGAIEAYMVLKPLKRVQTAEQIEAIFRRCPCGDPLTGNPNQRFCSAACKQRAYNERLRSRRTKAHG